MATFFRVQGKGINFQKMQGYQSTDVDGTLYNGLCCTVSVEDLRRYSEGYFVEDDDKYEIVIFKGIQTDEIYDGVTARPVEEIIRVSPSDFFNNENLCDYEEW